MTAHRLTNIALAVLIALVLSTSYLLPGPSQQQTDADITSDIAAAQALARATASCGGDVANCRAAYKRPRIAYSEGAAK